MGTVLFIIAMESFLCTNWKYAAIKTAIALIENYKLSSEIYLK